MFDIFSIRKDLAKLFGKKDIAIISLIVILFFVTRLIQLTRFPVFTDEGIYIHWAKVAWHDASWRFISLTDGRQPLQTWATIPFLKLFPDNALLAGRLFAVSTGFLSLTGMFFLLLYLFGKKAAFIGSFLYVFTPFFLFYDRLALADSGVNAAFIWIFLLSVLLVRKMRLDIALGLGLTAGLALLLKSSVRIFIAMILVNPVLIFEKGISKFSKRVVNFMALFGIAGVLSLIIYNIQRLSPFFHFVSEKNNTFVMTFGEFLKSPFSVFPHNLSTMPLYIFSELGWAVGFVGLLGGYTLFRKDRRLFTVISLWFVVPFLTIALFSRVLFPRYLIFLGAILLILAAYFFATVKRSTGLILAAIAVIFLMFFDYAILLRPSALPFPQIDRGQYVEGVTAGWHLEDIMEFARQQGREKPVVVLGEGNFGLVSDMLDVFLKRSDNVSIKGYWPLEDSQLRENIPLLKDHFVYVVFSHRDTFPKEWPIKLVRTYGKPGGQSAFYLFELVDAGRNYYSKSQ